MHAKPQFCRRFLTKQEWGYLLCVRNVDVRLVMFVERRLQMVFARAAMCPRMNASAISKKIRRPARASKIRAGDLSL